MIAWLEDLAAADRIEPSELTSRRYLKSLRQWFLEPEQWNCLSDRAILGFSRFPTISELYEIAWEIRHEAEIRMNWASYSKSESWTRTLEQAKSEKKQVHIVVPNPAI